MAGFSDEDLEKVRSSTDIVALFSEVVPVTMKGSSFWCVCPFHNDKNPSLKIDPSRQTFHCFGCQESGDVFSFVQKMDGVDFTDAVRKLAERAHIELTESHGGRSISTSYKARLKEICKETAEFYHTQLMRTKSDAVTGARQYMSGRQLGGSVPKNWHLGFAPGREALVRHLTAKGFKGEEMVDADVAFKGDDGRVRDRFYNRIMFPIYDLQGDCIAFGGRVVGKGEPKYLNSKETPIFKKSHVMFGFDRARATIASTGVAVVMEGYTDVILSHEAGFTNAVATLGTALTIDHIRQLAKFAKRVIYLFDGDAAGQKAIERALQFIDGSTIPEAGRLKIDLCAVTLPDDLDPADYISQYGVEEFRARINEARPLLQFGIERQLERYDLSNAEGRAQAFGAVLQMFAPIKDSIIAKDYVCQWASRLRIREDVALDELRHVKPAATSAQAAAQAPAPAVSKPKGSMPDYTDSRLRFERAFLSTCACNPQVAVEYCACLPTVNWRAPIHKVLAMFIAERVMENPDISCAALTAASNDLTPEASAILLGGQAADNLSLEELLPYLYEELSMGDMEESISRDRARLMSLAQMGAAEEEQDALFSAISDQQKMLMELKKSHKSLTL